MDVNGDHHNAVGEIGEEDREGRSDLTAPRVFLGVSRTSVGLMQQLRMEIGDVPKAKVHGLTVAGDDDGDGMAMNQATDNPSTKIALVENVGDKEGEVHVVASAGEDLSMHVTAVGVDLKAVAATPLPSISNGEMMTMLQHLHKELESVKADQGDLQPDMAAMIVSVTEKDAVKGKNGVGMAGKASEVLTRETVIGATVGTKEVLAMGTQGSEVADLASMVQSLQEELAAVKGENEILKQQLASIKGKAMVGSNQEQSLKDVVQGRPVQQSTTLLKFYDPKGNHNTVCIPRGVVKSGREKWKNTVVGFFVDGRKDVQTVVKEVKKEWSM